MEHHLIWTAIIGLLVGWLASVIVQGKGMGIIPDMVVGILGALVGSFLANTLHIYVNGRFLGEFGHFSPGSDRFIGGDPPFKAI